MINRKQLNLSFGQVVAALCKSPRGDPVTLSRLRYFRQLGVPFTEDEAQGSGNRLSYTFDHVFECGIAIESTRQGMKPSDAAEVIVSKRKDLRKLARDAFDEIPSDIFDEIGETAIGLGAGRVPQEIYLLLNGRHEKKPLTFVYITANEEDEEDSPPYVELADGSHRAMIGLKKQLLTWVVRGLAAPTTKPGR